MKSIHFVVFIVLVCTSCQDKLDSNEEKKSKLNYPESKKTETSDVYFGRNIPDPYRWLENDRSPETEEWVERQNEFTFDYLSQIPYRDTLQQRLADVWNYEKKGRPFIRGDYTYFFKNNGLQDQYVLYRFKEDMDKAEVFLDPNTFSEDGTTSLGEIGFSEDGTLVAYSISEGGSDWRSIITLNAETKEKIDVTIENVKFSGISWKSNEGFYYSSYDKPEGSQLSAKTDQHKLYYHQIGTSQKEDVVVFGGTPEQKRRYVSGSVTEDNRFLCIYASTSTTGNELYIKDLTKETDSLITVVDNFDADHYVLDSRGNSLYIVTDKDAPNKKIVTADIKQPTMEYWEDLIPETEHVLSASSGGGYIFTEYMVHAVSTVKQYNYEGKFIRDIDLPGVGSVGSISGKKHEKDLYYTFTNYIVPGNIYKYATDTGSSEIYSKAKIDFDVDNYESKQVFFSSKDGTKVPMIITYKKGIELDGNNPLILYGYGGFNVSLTPSFSIVNVVWMEQGGVYAVPNLRGGGEYGKEWHDSGTKKRKQNVFDDFIAAAEYLIENKYTSPKFLAISGASNGGLLVGAVMTQRPDLFQVALPAVGVMDMLRYHTFTSGAGWAYDYGTSEDNEEMFEYLYKYSPVHALKKGVVYPATLVTTGDHDDRVVPAHSFKFAATLQENHEGSEPTLIRIETNAGHGAGTPVRKRIEQNADRLSFTLYNMGYKHLPQPVQISSVIRNEVISHEDTTSSMQ